MAWGKYLQILLQGYDAPPARRAAVARRLQARTGISADYYLAHDLAITKIAFVTELLRSEERVLGTYDARYSGPASQAGWRPLDPFAKVTDPIEPLMRDYLANVLKVTWPTGDYRPAAPDTQRWTWNATLGPGGPFLDYDYPARITPAFAANPRFSLMIGTGIHDLTTTPGPARYMVARSNWPRTRVYQRRYVGGHMAYVHEPSHKAWTDDVRAWITGARLGPSMV